MIKRCQFLNYIRCHPFTWLLHKYENLEGLAAIVTPFREQHCQLGSHQIQTQVFAPDLRCDGEYVAPPF